MIAPPHHVVVFDLDDTLYLECDYAASGFDAVGRWMVEHHAVAGFAAAAKARFDAGCRGNIFDMALEDIGFAPVDGIIADMVHVYRHHPPDIMLAPDAAAWLDATPPGVAVALLTDGPAASQSRKIAALGLAAKGFWPIVMTDALGGNFGKPHARGFETIETAFGMPPGCFTYVADNALKDFVTPRARGWKTVQIVRKGRLHQAPPRDPSHAAHMVIDSLQQFMTDSCLQQIADERPV